MKRPRRTPYTEVGIKRVPCARCGEPSSQQWQICADGNQYRGLCNDCDALLNEIVMSFVGFPFNIIEYRSNLEDN